MSFTILHMQKLKQPAIKGIQIHNQREKESQTNPDIDESKADLNYDLVNETNIDYNEKINGMIEDGLTTGKAVRKDAVKVASFLVTSDREFFDNLSESEEKKFFSEAYEFFCEKYGKENIAYSMVHKDEKTPHMHVGFVPLTEDGRLSAKDFFGKKQQLVQLQDNFHQHMSEAGFDLERGVSSDRKHIEMQRLKALTINDEIKAIEERKMDLNLSLVDIQSRLSDLAKSLDGIKKVYEVEVKEKGGLIRAKTVELAFEDYEGIVTLAKASETLKRSVNDLKTEINHQKWENGSLVTENKSLKEKNKELKRENTLLGRENLFLTRTLERVSSYYKDKVQNFSKRIGAFKAEILDKMGEKILTRNFTNTEEIKGAQAFLKVKETEEAKEAQEREMRRKKERDQDYER